MKSLAASLVPWLFSSELTAGSANKKINVVLKNVLHEFIKMNHTPRPYCICSPVWVCVFGPCSAFAADVLLIVLSICWNCSCVKHTTLSFCCVTMQESFLLLPDWTLRDSVLCFALVTLGPWVIFCSTELTAGVSLLFLSCSALSGWGGPCFELMIFCVFFLGGIWKQRI